MKDYQLKLWGGKPGKFVILLISGKAGVGKSTVAKFMANYLAELNYRSSIVPFAAELKRCARLFFGWDGSKDTKGRKLLQDIGSVGRAYDLSVWAKAVVNRITADNIPTDFTLIDDWRYPDEAVYLNTLSDYVAIKIRVEGNDRQLYTDDSEEGSHESELSLPSADVGDLYYNFVIDNGLDTPLENLEGLCKKVIDIILERTTK